MAELVPYPFARLVRRMFRELEHQDSIFDLPRKRFVSGEGAQDWSVSFHAMRASTALGPAAGPHSQMAQNLVLAWLGGSRIMELKTVQIMDELKIPRPCIDMHNVGYNVEWSQELKLEQSLDEYVKGAMLIEMLRASGEIELAPGFGDVIYDMSVGYDLKGIQSPRVRAFIEGFMDASETVERLRAQIPDEFKRFRDLDYQTKLSRSLTLSTFHGCPPDEIERIIDFLLREHGLHCVIKLNPTLLGPERVRHLLHDEMGYAEAVTPDEAFEKDTKWDDAVGFTRRLKATADSLGLSLGVKFSNTLIVRNHRDFFPSSEKEMYLSGPPLHVLAMNLVRDWRREFGTSIPISFAAGIDKRNFPDAVALGLTPITTCSDLLQPGGYGRQQGYFAELARRMEEADAWSVPEFIQRAYGVSAPTLDEAILLNTELYAERCTADARYGKRANSAVPKKIGSHLTLFDCVTCDKCIPVCPNDANFALAMPKMDIPIRKLHSRTPSASSGTPTDPERWEVITEGAIPLTMKHQIANFADFCNECGNCDVFCPEDGGPYIVKPRFFGSLEQFKAYPDHDGFYMERQGDTQRVHARFERRAYVVEVGGGEGPTLRFAGEGFDVTYEPADPARTASGHAKVEVDLTIADIINALRTAIFASDAPVTYVNA